MINFIIITHGEFGAYLVEAAEGIVGAQAEGVGAVPVRSRQSLQEIRGQLESHIHELQSPQGLIIFTDIVGGTANNIALPLVVNLSKTTVISGVNLYMLISAFSHRQSFSFDDLTQKVLEDSKKSIQDTKKLLLAKSAPDNSSKAEAP